jgi:hypothetical protein
LGSILETRRLLRRIPTPLSLGHHLQLVDDWQIRVPTFTPDIAATLARIAAGESRWVHSGSVLAVLALVSTLSSYPAAPGLPIPLLPSAYVDGTVPADKLAGPDWGEALFQRTSWQVQTGGRHCRCGGEVSHVHEASHALCIVANDTPHPGLTASVHCCRCLPLLVAGSLHALGLRTGAVKSGCGVAESHGRRPQTPF